jgi:hypothetical protein
LVVPTIESVEQVVLPPVRPRRVWYGVGAALAIAGVLVSFLMFSSAAFDYLGRIDDLAPVPVTGSQTVQLDDGVQLLFHEPDQGGAWSAASLLISVIDPAGERVSYVDPGSPESYDIDGRFGVAIGEFDAPVGGDYVVSVSADPGGAGGVVVVGPSPSKPLAASGVRALLVAAAGIVAGLVLMIVVWRRRRSAQAKRLGGWPVSGNSVPVG